MPILTLLALGGLALGAGLLGSQAPGGEGSWPVPEEGFADWDAAIAGLPVPDLPTGEGSITGSVRSLDGSPVDGVEVVAWPKAGPEEELPDLLVEEVELGPYVRRAVLEWYRKRKAAARDRTDAEGRFRLEAIGEGPYGIHAVRPGYAWTGSRSGGEVAAFAGDEVELLAKPGWEVPVTVLHADGSRADRARILIKRGPYELTYPYAGPSQSYTLELGEWELRAFDLEDDEVRSEAVQLDLSIEEEPEQVTLTLP